MLRRILLILFLTFISSRMSHSIETDDKKILCTTKYKSFIRQKPTTHSDIVTRLKQYTPLIEISREGKWVEVEGVDFEGWIYSSLVKNNIECMLLKKQTHSHCMGKAEIPRRLIHHEGFKVLKKSIACNYVMDRYFRKFWVDSTNAWPESTKIIISPL